MSLDEILAHFGWKSEPCFPIRNVGRIVTLPDGTCLGTLRPQDVWSELWARGFVQANQFPDATDFD